MPTLADIRARYAAKPYELILDDGSTLPIPAPASLGALMDAEEASGGSILEVLVTLAGERGEELRGVLRDLPPGALLGIRDEAYLFWSSGKSGS
jgi:hypothetical protein